MTNEQESQINDRAQFRRYAEAALTSMTNDLEIFDNAMNQNIAGMAFSIATAMMLAESERFEGYQLMASQVAIDKERKRQGVKQPYTDPQ